MKKDKEKKLKEDFPQIFADLYDCTPQESCMAWGVAVGDGWYDLIYKLCEDIMALNPPENFKVAQVKEKFGGLRFYIAFCSENKLSENMSEIERLIDVAEEESFKICECCGSREEVTTDLPRIGSWIQTLCKKCKK